MLVVIDDYNHYEKIDVDFLDSSTKKIIEIKLPSPPTEDFFTNDGSFMEKFMKLQGSKGE